jgi:Ulp1 family protease
LIESDAVAASGNFNIIATDCLREGGWLNDEVMNFYFELLRARSERVSAEQKTRQKCFFFNTFFYAQLANTNAGYCYQNVERWTRRLMSPLFSHDVVFVPIHVRDSHWCLAVMRLRDKKIEYWDSLRGRDEGCLRVPSSSFLFSLPFFHFFFFSLPSFFHFPFLSCLSFLFVGLFRLFVVVLFCRICCAT